MNVLAYIRVSADKEEIIKQREVILNYARRKRIKISSFIEYGNLHKTFKIRRLCNPIERLHEGDILLVSELSYLGRRVEYITKIIYELIRRGIQIITVKEGITFGGGK